MSADHVVMGDNAARCLNCGVEQMIAMPCSISVLIAIGEAFGKDHRACKPSAAGRSRMTYGGDPYEWLRSWDTGSSSKTIWHFMMTGRAVKPEIPYDPSDFGRCYRLLAAFPMWRPRMPEMGAAIAVWRPFCDAWPRLEALWDEESKSPSGRAPKLYALLQECRKPAPTRVPGGGVPRRG